MIIGDAAHATTPFMAQGAAMAMEDGVVLAEMVASRTEPIPTLLASFERRRLPRVSIVQQRSLAVARDWDEARQRELSKGIVQAAMQASVDDLYRFLSPHP